MADKDLNVKMKFEDDFTEGAERAEGQAKKLDKSVDDLSESTVEANIQFLATVEAVDKLGGGVAKIRGGLEDLGIVNEETAESLRKVEGAADLMVGSAEIAIVTMHVWKGASDALKMSLIGTTFAAMGVGAAFLAINAQTEETRALFSALTGVSMGLAAAQFTLAAANSIAWVAANPLLAPVLIGAIAATVAGLATYIAAGRAAASAQTAPGEVKVLEVEGTGNVLVHAGEQMIVGRPGPREGGRRRGREFPVTINFIGVVGTFDQRALDKTEEIIGRVVSNALGGEL